MFQLSMNSMLLSVSTFCLSYNACTIYLFYSWTPSWWCIELTANALWIQSYLLTSWRYHGPCNLDTFIIFGVVISYVGLLHIWHLGWTLHKHAPSITWEWMGYALILVPCDKRYPIPDTKLGKRTQGTLISLFDLPYGQSFWSFM